MSIDLDITNNSGMFKAVTAAYKVEDDKEYLVMALSGTGYHHLYKGTYELACANGTHTENWIEGYENADGKYEFVIPINGDAAFIPLVAISQSYYTKYLNGQNSLERAFYPRYVKLDVDAGTLETGDYEFKSDLTVTDKSANEDKLSLTGAAINTVGGPNSINYKCQLELTMGDDTYSKVFVGKADEIGEDSETIDIGDGRLFAIPVKWVETFGQPETMMSLLADTFVVSFYSANDSKWHMYKFKVDEGESTLELRHTTANLVDFEYYIDGEDVKSAIILKYTGSSKKVVIPETIEGNSVRTIGLCAFKGCSSLESVVIPNGVMSIEDSAFFGCSNLQSVNLPDGITSIGAYTFYGCSSLKNIEIPESVSLIVDQAFRDCRSLESIDIPDNVTNIGNQAFDGCSNLVSIKLSNKLTGIGTCTFRDCSSLESIDIPDSVTSIEAQAFDGCSNLVSVKLSNKLTSIDLYTFKDCSSLESIEIPDGVTNIGEGAFAGCSNMVSIEIPDSVTSIGENAFFGCSKAKFYVVKGSYAEEYLKANNIEYEYLKSNEVPTAPPTENSSVAPTALPTMAPAAPSTEKPSEAPAVSPTDQKSTEAPAKVNLKSVKNVKGKKLKAIWKKVTGAKGYEVQYSLNKKFKKATTKTAKKPTLTIKKLKKGKTYYVRVRAYTIDASGKKIPGEWSKTKKVKVTK